MMEAIKPAPEKLQRWLEGLRHADETVRVHAALRLARPGQDISEAAGALHEALNDPEPHVRKLAAWVLARIEVGRAA